MSISSSVKSPVSSSATPSVLGTSDNGLLGTQPIPKKSLQIKTDKPRPHICTICTRAFARLEHLKRHERSHTHEKPFQCAACGRCFARRDLVLRHQQKLHSTLPNVMRRGSTKDLDSNENIIILHNNTNANAPLPANNFGDSQSFNNSPNQPQLYSPPKSNDAAANPNMPQFRTSLFNHTPNYVPSHSQSPNNIIPSPLHSSSNQTTPPNGQNGNNLAQQNQQHSPMNMNNHDSPPKLILPKHIPSHVQQDHQSQNMHLSQKFRHSFSASSAISYTNIKDATDIQQNNTIAEAPSQVDFATPQLQAMDMNFGKHNGGIDANWSGIDWNNIDYLDLNHHGLSKNVSPINFAKFNHNNSIPKEKSSNKIDKSMDSYFEQQVMMAHQFLDPNHPHHIRGTTPFQFATEANELGMFQNIKSDNETSNSNFSINNEASNNMKRISSNEALGPKKVKLEDPLLDNGNWLAEIINAPLDSNFPTASHHIGFFDSPDSNNSAHVNEISSLFRSRQMDLVNDMKPHFVEMFNDSNGNHLDAFRMKADHDDGFITNELRNRIILMSNLSNRQFPPLEDIKHYMVLYELIFDKYFPFIHLPSLKSPLVDNFENIPLLLSMASIGALYAFHDSNSLLLFNLSKLHIHNFFEKEISLDKLEVKKVPLMAHQCLVLHTFISLFLNENNNLEVNSKQLKSMTGLVLSTGFNKPLENYLVPPPQLNEVDHVVVQNNFDYFILAQTRIRTISVFQMLDCFRSTLLGVPVVLPSSLTSSGNHCLNENLWKATDSSSWLEELKKMGNKETIVELSNSISNEELIDSLAKHRTDKKLSYFNILKGLMYVHEQIGNEIQKISTQEFNLVNWRLNIKSKLSDLVKSWEALFISNGGFVVINEHNNHILNTSHEFKLILPLYSYAKMRLSVHLTPVMRETLYKNWVKMNSAIDCICKDSDGMNEALSSALDVIRLWIHNISVIQDAKQTSIRAPVFFVTCSYASIVIISSYLFYLENSTSISVVDKANWLKCEKILLEVEKLMSPISEENVHSEFFKDQESKALKSINSQINLKSLIDSNSSNDKVIATMRDISLSSKSLYLGVRILTDAPVWPMAMVLAEALKRRAAYIGSK